MNANRMLMGAAIIGCLTAAMAPGAYAQEGGVRLSAQSNARANGQVARHAAAGERRVGTSRRLNISPRPSRRDEANVPVQKDACVTLNAEKNGRLRVTNAGGEAS
jgi:hypothetical protein